MSINDVTAGNRVPHEFNVIIEIPSAADPVKYEVDKQSGALFVDRFMMTAMHYPANYGYIPKTVADDEIALTLERPVGTVKTWLHRARLEILDRLRKRGMVPEENAPAGGVKPP